jgi:hypothetical protein
MLSCMSRPAPAAEVTGAAENRAALAISPRHVWIWLACLVTVYGGLLRFEALVANYGWMGQPAWSASLARYATPIARELRPERVTWGETRDPYVNGDPINYLRFAREMTHFYQAHVREPVFLAWTRAWLWLCGGRDIGLSFASAAGSTAAILATYLLGAVAVSPLVGLLAALGLAVEFQAIALSIEGWRDDTFMCMVALSAAALLGLGTRPTPLRGVLAGVAMAGACLTRITALSFVVPAMLWIVVANRRQLARTGRGLALALLTASALVAPYLINCARATGDPLLAINYHTRYYRAAEGRSTDRPESAFAYVSGKVINRPVSTFDTAMQGIISFPFVNKWHGLGHWHDRLPALVRWPAAVGMLCALFSGTGRFMLLMLFTSLIPYAVTWSVGGGGEWRFTQHAYPFYLVFAAWTVVAGGRWFASAIRGRTRWMPERRSLRLTQLGVVVAIVIAGALWQRGLPLLAANEALREGEAVTIVAGDRDSWLFEGAWSDPVVGGVPFRIARATVTAMRLPVGGRSDFWLTLRIDPAETEDPARQPRVTVYLDRRPVAQLRLSRDPARMGSYRIRIADHPTRTFSRLELVASHMVSAREAGPFFTSVPPDAPVAFRLWYVRVDPDIQP